VICVENEDLLTISLLDVNSDTDSMVDILLVDTARVIVGVSLTLVIVTAEVDSEDGILVTAVRSNDIEGETVGVTESEVENLSTCTIVDSMVDMPLVDTVVTKVGDMVLGPTEELTNGVTVPLEALDKEMTVGTETTVEESSAVTSKETDEVTRGVDEKLSTIKLVTSDKTDDGEVDDSLLTNVAGVLVSKADLDTNSEGDGVSLTDVKVARREELRLGDCTPVNVDTKLDAETTKEGVLVGVSLTNVTVSKLVLPIVVSKVADTGKLGDTVGVLTADVNNVFLDSDATLDVGVTDRVKLDVLDTLTLATDVAITVVVVLTVDKVKRTDGLVV
jgi:hypothetical protein